MLLQQQRERKRPLWLVLRRVLRRVSQPVLPLVLQPQLVDYILIAILLPFVLLVVQPVVLLCHLRHSSPVELLVALPFQLPVWLASPLLLKLGW